jgi:hypothetical protein
MDKKVAVSGAIGIVVGAVAASVITVALIPNGSPVIIRGGSVYLDLTSQWHDVSQNSDARETNLGSSGRTLVLSDVEKKGDNTPQSYTLSMTSNWKITIAFKDNNNGKGNNTLILCTRLDQNSKKCDTGGPLNTISSNTLYFLSDRKGKFKDGSLGNNGTYSNQYDVSECDGATGSPETSNCNHIFNIEIDNGAGRDEEYTCAGNDPIHCTININ